MPTKPTILVVDDDQPIVMLMARILREFGFDSVTATSGEDAIEAARSHNPALVLLDKNMPGMTGAEVVHALRAMPEFERTPILMLSGEPMSPDQLAEMRADGAVLKPFDVTALIDEIRRFVNGS